MAWEISITVEGWEEIRKQLHTWEKEDLAKALGDYNYEIWHSGHIHHKGWWNWKKYMHLPVDILADEAFDFLSEVNTCDNGGNGFWIDPEGYHKVYLSD